MSVALSIKVLYSQCLYTVTGTKVRCR